MSEGSEFYIDEFDGDINAGGGKYLDKIKDRGWMHFIIEEVDDPQTPREKVEKDDGDSYTKADGVKLTLRVLAPIELKDKMTDLYLSRTGGFAKRTAKFASMMGLITQELIDNAREQGQASIIIPWKALVGTTFCAEREKDTYKKDGVEMETSKIRWNFMSAKDGAAAGHPVDTAELSDPFSDPPSEEQDAAPFVV